LLKLFLGEQRRGSHFGVYLFIFFVSVLLFKEFQAFLCFIRRKKDSPFMDLFFSRIFIFDVHLGNGGASKAFIRSQVPSFFDAYL